MTQKNISTGVALFLIVIFIIIVLLGKFGEKKPLSVLTEYTYSGGNVQKYFKNCNPCSVKLEINHEENPFGDVRFGVPSVSGDCYSKEWSCVVVGSGKMDCRESGYVYEWDCQAFPERFCYSKGYSGSGIGTTTGPYCYQTPSCIYHPRTTYCIGNEVNCYKDLCGTPDWVEIRYGGTVYYRWEKTGSQPVETNNMADMINNDQCVSNLFGRDCATDPVCDTPCNLYLEVYASHNYGDFEITAFPTVLTYGVPPKNASASLDVYVK